MNKIQRLVGAVLFLTLAAVGAAQGITFTDKAGEMSLTHISNWSAKLDSKDRSTIHFKATGAPLTAAWKSQALSINANKIDGVAKRDKTGAFTLVSATITGHVHAVARKARQTIVTDSDAADIHKLGTKTTMVLTGHVAIDSDSPAIGQKISLTGNSGSVDLVDGVGLTSATLDGSVHCKTTRSGDGTPITMVADCGHLSLDAAATPGVMTLSGGVSISGTEPALAGDIVASSLTIQLDPNFQPIQIEATGEPGITHVQDRRSGGAP